MPGVLIKCLGRESIIDTLNGQELQTYRDAILTKKLASMAFYAYGDRWEDFLAEVEADLRCAMGKIV